MMGFCLYHRRPIMPQRSILEKVVQFAYSAKPKIIICLGFLLVALLVYQGELGGSSYPR